MNSADSNDRETLFENAFQYASIGMALVSPSGSWLKVNAALCDMLGYSDAELKSLTFQDITHPEDLDADLAYVRRMLDGEIKTYQMEKRYFHKDGSIVWILLSVSLVRKPCGDPKFFISQIKDVTRRKEVELALRATLGEKERLLAELEASTREIEQLRQQLVTFCAWTRQIKHQGRWMPADEFLINHLKLTITHGISEEGEALFLKVAAQSETPQASPITPP